MVFAFDLGCWLVVEQTSSIPTEIFDVTSVEPKVKALCRFCIHKRLTTGHTTKR